MNTPDVFTQVSAGQYQTENEVVETFPKESSWKVITLFIAGLALVGLALFFLIVKDQGELFLTESPSSIGQANLRPGDRITVRWDTADLPPTAYVHLFLSNGLHITVVSAKKGSYTWRVPYNILTKSCSGYSDMRMRCSSDDFNRPLTIDGYVYMEKRLCLQICPAGRSEPVLSLKTEPFKLITSMASTELITCPAEISPICGYTKTTPPKTYSNACHFSQVQGKKLYNEECDDNKNPSVKIHSLNLANEGRRDHPGNYLRLFFNNYVERGVFIGDIIEINTIYSNTEAIKDAYITLRNNVTQKEYGTLITENFATSTLFPVPASLPQNEWYDLILRLRDYDDIVLYENVTWLGPIFVKSKSE